MGADKKLILSLRPAHGCFIADLVGLLRCHFAGRKRLPDLKKQSSTIYCPACFRLVLAFSQKKLSQGRCRIAEIGRHSSYLFRIEPVGKPILHRLDSRFSCRYLVGPDISCSREYTSFQKKTAAVRPAAILLIFLQQSYDLISYFIQRFTFCVNSNCTRICHS